jgi:molecular chaperone Hsp33
MLFEDTLQRFLLEGSPVRGELVHLDTTWKSMIQDRAYPEPVRDVLGQFAAAIALLASTLKFNGSLILQIQGDGPISLLVMECDSQGTMRGMAKWSELPPAGTLPELVGTGKLAITIDPKAGRERYQGIVELDGKSVAEVLMTYLQRSEQLATRLWLAADEQRASGLLLQRMPGSQGEAADEDWNRANLLAETITGEELLDLAPREIIHRLYHEEDVRLFEPRPLRFGCSCSRDRVIRTLRILGYQDLQSLLEERGSVSVDCEFCNQHYEFDAVDVEQIFAAANTGQASPTRH